MAESTLKIGQVESTIQFDKTNAQVTELLESLMGEDWNTEGMTAKEKLEAVHRRMLEVVVREIESSRINAKRREIREQQRAEMHKVREEARILKRETRQDVANRGTIEPGETTTTTGE